ncbi:MAG: hypothetical protein AB7H97_00065 [Pseudobdellovibrionaceae bacterium]
MEVAKEKLNGKTSLSVQDPGIKSEKSDKSEAIKKEVPSIHLSPDQIEEIHADEYSLLLFYATRVEPLTVAEIKKQFPEPEPKKAQSVLERFIKVGLIYITPDGKYYSYFPENYINYADYRYDKDLEAKKDNKVFTLMKEFTGNKEYWKNKSYFSMDAFYTEEQTKEIQKMFYEIKVKAKEYANENSKKKSIRGLFFRRLKFYDMIFSLLLCVLCSIGIAPKASAGGNDPTILSQKGLYYQHLLNRDALAAIMRAGGGNDPTGQVAIMMLPSERIFTGGGNEPIYKRALRNVTVSNYIGRGLVIDPIIDPIKAIIGDDGGKYDGGGGHDPTCVKPIIRSGGGHDPAGKDTNSLICCVVYDEEGKEVPVNSKPLCHAQALLIDLMMCEQDSGENCPAIEGQLLETLSRPRSGADQ